VRNKQTDRQTNGGENLPPTAVGLGNENKEARQRYASTALGNSTSGCHLANTVKEKSL